MTTIYDELNALQKSNLSQIKELKNKIERIELDKHDQFLDLVNGIIDVIDTFEKAEEVIIEKELNKSEESIKVMNRYNTVQSKLLKLLQKYGITKIDFPEKKLMVGFCKVIETEPDSTKANDTILTIVRNGYIRGKELIREAEVIIVKN